MKARLTPSRIGRLRPKQTEFTVWDTATPHLGVRVTPTGAMRFIHTAQTEGRLRKRTLGDAKRLPLDEARAIAREIDAGGGSESELLPYFRDWTSAWWDRSTAHLKPSTRELYRFILDRKLLPTFGRKRLDAITRRAVFAWFERESRTAPGAANIALAKLRSILQEAVDAEILTANPARRISYNPGKRITRFLSDEERARLLAKIDAVLPMHRSKALAVRMLLFTGCRCGEIRTLRWSEVGNGVLQLKDAKTGPRTVWLNDEAISILAEARSMRAEAGEANYVFPHPLDATKCMGDRGFFQFWKGLRERAGIPDVRIHDLRHSFASEAVRRGIPLAVVSKLLGHTDINMTMRYAHASNAEAEEAAERIGHQLIHQFRWGVESSCSSSGGTK